MHVVISLKVFTGKQMGLLNRLEHRFKLQTVRQINDTCSKIHVIRNNPSETLQGCLGFQDGNSHMSPQYKEGKTIKSHKLTPW